MQLRYKDIKSKDRPKKKQRVNHDAAYFKKLKEDVPLDLQDKWPEMIEEAMFYKKNGYKKGAERPPEVVDPFMGGLQG
jgi:hypothetical protein